MSKLQRALDRHRRALGLGTGLGGAVEDIETGSEILTPFGVATVLSVEVASDRIRTDLGTWDLSEAKRTQYDKQRFTPVEWIDAPAWEVSTRYDLTHRPCGCRCRSCHWQWSIHKLIGEGHPLSHMEVTADCRCREGGCLCVGRPLGEVDD